MSAANTHAAKRRVKALALMPLVRGTKLPADARRTRRSEVLDESIRDNLGPSSVDCQCTFTDPGPLLPREENKQRRQPLIV